MSGIFALEKSEMVFRARFMEHGFNGSHANK